MGRVIPAIWLRDIRTWTSRPGPGLRLTRGAPSGARHEMIRTSITSASGGVASSGRASERPRTRCRGKAQGGRVQSMPATRARTTIRARSRPRLPRPASGRATATATSAVEDCSSRICRRDPDHQAQFSPITAVRASSSRWSTSASCQHVQASSSCHARPKKRACRISPVPAPRSHEGMRHNVPESGQAAGPRWQARRVGSPGSPAGPAAPASPAVVAAPGCCS